TLAVRWRVDLRLAEAIGLQPRVASIMLGIIGWLIISWSANRLLGVFVWDRLDRHRGQHVPRLLTQLTGLSLYVAIGVGMATNLFGMPLTGVIATSSVLGFVVGFAAKSLIADTFSGIALNLDRGFAIGDFVRVHSRGIPAQIIGRVTEINWRSTYILTPENNLLTVPNSVMAEAMVVNLSQPDALGEFEHFIILDFAVPAERATRILSSALEAARRDTPALSGLSARVSLTSEMGVHYKLKYMLDPSRLAPGKAKDLVHRHVLRHLAKAGLALAHPKQDSRVFAGREEVVRPGSDEYRRNLIHQVELFRRLSSSDVELLAGRLAERSFAPGAQIFAAGEAGESMFILAEGIVAVRVSIDGRELEVASLGPGEFFGEMSLLTGEPRSATLAAATDVIAYEIGKADMAAVLAANPAAAEAVSMAAAERRMATADALSHSEPEQVAAETRSLAGQIMARMGKFFGRKQGAMVA
ncbi:MAG: mechanosensitive ion channel family protein, partial [Alphaproteobacteria bacterium]|nr:mechanosensitive ion channel family protein [Alphaproteobacteria bacterium]